MLSLLAGNGIWYRVDTWMGEIWIRNPDLLESVKETPVSYMLKLTGSETVYPQPFSVTSLEEKIDPRVVKVKVEWNNRTGPSQGFLWLKIDLPQGERWLAPKHATLPDCQNG